MCNGRLYPSFNKLTIAVFAFKVSLELSESPYPNSHHTRNFFDLFFVFHIDIDNYYFHINNLRLFKFDKLSAVNAATIEQKLYLSVMSLSLCSLVRSSFVSAATQFSTSKTKPWPLLLFLMLLLDVSLVIVDWC